MSASHSPLKFVALVFNIASSYFFFGSTAVLLAREPIRIDDAQVLLIQNTTFAAPIAGWVRAVEVAEGDQVASDRTLLQLDEQRAGGELRAATAALEAAVIQSENDVNTRYAQRTLEVRKRELQQSDEANKRYAGSVTETEIDRLQLVIDQAELSVEQAQQERDVATANAAEKRAACELAALRVQEHTIRTTIAGEVAEVLVQTGQWVEPGTPILRLISLDPIRISGFIDGQQYDRSLVGRIVTFEIKPVAPFDPPAPSIATPDATVLRGVVTFVSAELNPITSQVRLWATIENPDHQARPGMRGILRIE